jgi:periplasmic protein TonB
MSAHAIHWETWALQDASDRRFRRLCLQLAVPVLLLSLIVPWLELAGVQRGGGAEGQRYAELLSEPAPVTAPEEKPTPQPEQKTAPPRPELTQEQRVERARARAERMLSAVRSDLAELQSLTPTTDTAPLLTARSQTGSTAETHPTFAAAAAATSGGIGETEAVRRDSSQTGVGERRTTAVESAIGTGGPQPRAGQGGDKRIAARTLEEIQLAFDRAKVSFYVIYNRAMRTNPNLSAGGKIVLSLTIAPNGTVTDCRVVSSDFRDPEFERRVVQRVLLLKFDPKDVPPFTYPNYPLHFFPT